MTDNELKRLKDLPVPAPRERAKASALAAALAAFDANVSNAETSETSEKSSDAPQGNAASPRHTHASPQTQRSRLMRVTPTHYKIAASITVLLIAAPLAYHASIKRHTEEFYGQTPVLSPHSNGKAGTDGSCCGDLDERVAELETAVARKGTLRMYGQVNKGLLIWDDGIEPDAFATDNTTPTSRFGFKGKAQIAPSWTAGYSMEFEVGDGASGKVTENSGSEQNGVPIRQKLAVVESDKYGRISIAEQSPGSTEKHAGLDASEPKPIQSRLDDEQSGAAGEQQTASGKPQPVQTVRVSPDGSLGNAPAAAPLPPRAEQQRQRVASSQQPSASTPVTSKDGRRLAETESSDVAGLPEYDDNTNKFDAPTPNPIKRAAAESVSTFSVDVDTASYAYTRRALNSGHLPPKDSVRVEEMINYFPYNYPRPEKAETPFQPTVTVAPAPWNSAHKLMHIGIKGYNITATTRPRANLVFLIDVSGSMSSDDRLPLVKNAFRMLLDELQPDDTVAIVTYASGSGVALEPTRIRNKAKILEAIDRLGAGGSTSGARGIQDAYTLAEATFDKAAVNRIILATDGDFNVGITNPEELKGYVERKRQSGIFLSILGVGEGNYNDALMQKLAQNGNGTAAYVDTLNEARKVLVDEASSTLFTIAKDVKIQVEFNPAQVSEYRLIGYETRALKREDFNNDKVDAGDIGSGHTVTAIYEITPAGAPTSVDELRYQKPDAKPAATGQASEYAFLKIRYKLPNEDTSKLITQAIDREMEKPSIDAAPEDVRFSVAVAAFGQLIRDLPYLQNYRYDDVIALAQGARGPDNFGYRAEFVNLVRLAKSARQ